MTQHTPGPWYCDDTGAVFIYKQQQVCCGNGTVSGECCGNPDVSADYDKIAETSPANAHLIAAAPKLLEALKETSKWIDEQIGFMGPCDHEVGLCVCQDYSLLHRVNEAIAKAEGRT